MSATPTLWSSASALVARDLRLLWRRRGDALQPALFAVLVVVLFALALGNEPAMLRAVAASTSIVFTPAPNLWTSRTFDAFARSSPERGRSTCQITSASGSSR